MVDTSRAFFRQQRRNLSVQQQASNSCYLTRHLIHFLRFKKYHKVACYLPNDGEISALPLTHQFNNRLKFYLPILSQLSFNGLQFGLFNQRSVFVNNRFGIKEPIVAKRNLLNASDLDVILLPLVAFDKAGNRMGMGGGFYDRAVKIRQRRPCWRKPLLIGLAHSIQQADALKSEQWDIPLDAIATEKGVLILNK